MQHTKNLNLNKVDYGTQEWHEYLNNNFDIIDEAIAESNNSDSIINSVEPSTHKAGRVWVDKIGQDGKVIKGKYKIDNGIDYDEMHFETEAELVKCKNGENVEKKIENITTNTTEQVANLKKDVTTQYEESVKKTDKKIQDFIDTKNKPNGIAGLDENGKIKADQIPTSGIGMWGKISDITCEQNSKEVVFTNINDNYRYFKIVFEARNCNPTHVNSFFYLYFNDDLEPDNYKTVCKRDDDKYTIVGQYNNRCSYVCVTISNLYNYQKETRITAQLLSAITEYFHVWNNDSTRINKIALRGSNEFIQGSHFTLWGCK